MNANPDGQFDTISADNHVLLNEEAVAEQAEPIMSQNFSSSQNEEHKVFHINIE